MDDNIDFRIRNKLRACTRSRLLSTYLKLGAQIIIFFRICHRFCHVIWHHSLLITLRVIIIQYFDYILAMPIFEQLFRMLQVNFGLRWEKWHWIPHVVGNRVHGALIARWVANRLDQVVVQCIIILVEKEYLLLRKIWDLLGVLMDFKLLLGLRRLNDMIPCFRYRQLQAFFG